MVVEYFMNSQLSIKKIAYNLIVLFISIIVAIILGEIIIRIFIPQQESMRWFKSDAKYGYTLKRNFHQKYHYLGSDFVMEVQTNSLGHRYKEYDSLTFNDPNIKKILLIGDSFTFGYGINLEDQFGFNLEKLLNKSNDNFMIINAGVGGWGTLQATCYANDNFSFFKPDIIIYTFCGNDPEDDILFENKLADNEKGVLYFPGKVFLRDHSHLYRFIFSRLKIYFHQIKLKRKSSVQPNRNILLDTQSASIITEKEWNKTLNYLKDFHKDFIEFNPHGLLLIQASAPWNTDIRDHLKSISNDSNLIYVDLYEETISIPEIQRRLPHDGHWSERIHFISAINLHNIISNRNLLLNQEKIEY